MGKSTVQVRVLVQISQHFMLQFIHIYKTRHYRKLGIPSHQEPAQLLLVLPQFPLRS